MKLRSLALTNFRQHAESRITFRDGVTGIIGPNGAGKSTILEAIAWAVYGSSAARGTNDTIRFSRAPGRSRVEVELALEIAGHEYRVVRSLYGADVWLDDGVAPVATGLGPVTEYLRGRLGMRREEFFNTYFTGQKELQFLAQMGPTQRGRFLSQVLGYERLRIAQELARRHRNERRHEADGLRSALPDPRALADAAAAAESAERAAADALAAAKRARSESADALARVEPRWHAARAAREQARELAHAIDVADRERETAERDAQRARAELARIAQAQERLGTLGIELAVLPDLATHCERQAELARRAERRRALEEREKQLAEESREAATRIGGLERAPELLRQIEAQLEERRAALAAAERRVEEVHGNWIQAKQDVRTRLGSYRDRARELREQISQLREAGPEGVCPTCERPLRDEFENVLAALEDEWNSVVQDGKWMSQREKQLEPKPDELVAAERERAAVVDALEKDRERHGRCVRAASELGVLIQERERRAEALDSLRAELAELPGDYDQAAHRAAEARLAELRGLEREAAKLEQAVDQHGARRKELDDADAAIAAAAARIAELERSHADVGYDETSYAELESAHEIALDQARRAELRQTEAAGRLETATAAAAKAAEDLEEDRRRRVQLEGLESTIRHHVELDDAFAELRAELNARVRPELGDLASRFLTEITDGRYTSLEIDDDYNVLVLDEGEEKPVISGGEEDIANLVLRLAISQMIAERAGHPLSILILDEVFGSLDVERRDNVIQLLHRLSDRFEQVILITHVETVRDGLDNVVRVDFDERTGASVVRQEEEPVPGEELVAVG